MIKQVACLLATALLLVPATSRASGEGEGTGPAATGGGHTGIYYPPQSPAIPDLDLAPNEMLNRNVRILRTTNKAQLNRYVPVAYKFNNVNPYAVRRFINRAIESEDGSLFTFISPEGNSGRLLAMVPEYQIPSLDKLVAEIDRADLTSSDGSQRAYVQLKHRRADLSDSDFLANLGLYLTGNGDTVIIDPEQNAVYIEDAPSGTEYLLAALEEKLDKPTPQVLASVNVYEVDGTNNARLGNDYIAWKNGPGSNLFAIGAFYERGRTEIRSDDFHPNVAPIPPHNDFSAKGYNYAFNFEHSSAFFDFLVANGKAKVLTKAKLAALNTRTARITAGDQILYYAVQNDSEDGFRDEGDPFEANQDRTVIGTRNAFQTVVNQAANDPLVQNINVSGANIGSNVGNQYSEAGGPDVSDNVIIISNESGGDSSSEELLPLETDLEIELTPVIYENGADINVTGDLDTYNGYDDTGFPRINNRAFQTQVRMGEGQEIVLGGLARNETTRAGNKPPALGDLPVLGFLFGQENTRRRESTIVMSLSLDQIVRFDGDQTGKTADEDAVLKQANGESTVSVPNVEIGLTPGL